MFRASKIWLVFGGLFLLITSSYVFISLSDPGFPTSYEKCIQSPNTIIGDSVFDIKGTTCTYAVYEAPTKATTNGENIDKEIFNKCLEFGGEIGGGYSEDTYQCVLKFKNPDFLFPTNFRECTERLGHVTFDFQYDIQKCSASISGRVYERSKDKKAQERQLKECNSQFLKQYGTENVFDSCSVDFYNFEAADKSKVRMICLEPPATDNEHNKVVCQWATGEIND